MLKHNQTNCFSAYVIDFVWKIIQVKLAFMVRQLNWKVNKDLREKDNFYNMEILKQKAEYELKLEDLRKEIEKHKKVIEQQNVTNEGHLTQIKNKNESLREYRYELDNLRNPPNGQLGHFLESLRQGSQEIDEL